LNEVAAVGSLDGPISKSKSKATTKTSKKSKLIEDDEFESLEEDDAKEREAALSSPMKGKDFRQSTAVSFFINFIPFLIIVVD
jgi:hypothetical protein